MSDAGKEVRIGILEGGINDEQLQRGLTNGCSHIVASSDEGRRFGAGTGHQLYFRNPAEKVGVYNLLENEGWKPWGPDSYLLTGVPLYAIINQLRRIFPGATFWNAVSNEEVAVKTGREKGEAA